MVAAVSGARPEAPHIPVLLDEVCSALQPLQDATVVDGTFGAGGYTQAILSGGASTVIAIDRDPNALAAASWARDVPELRLVEGVYGELDQVVLAEGMQTVDGVVLDIGVSSMQLDEAERGFSFQQDGPLDMRMAQSGVTAADVVNHARQPDLTRIIGLLGEEKKASRVSAAIAREREKATISTTLQLAKVVERALGRKHDNRIHPATRTFQALRIFVNAELEQLGKALLAAEAILKEGGRLVVVTFHSLEDRIVKLFFKDRAENKSGSRHMPQVEMREPTFALSGKGLLKAGKAESEANPRSRSAKLRWGIRTSASARNRDLSVFGLPELANIQSFAQGAS